MRVSTIVNPQTRVEHGAPASRIQGEGIRGLVGPQGPPGPSGSGGTEWVFASPSTTWIINHNFGYRPSVEVFTVGGVEMIAEVVHTSVNQVLVLHNVAMPGYARTT